MTREQGGGGAWDIVMNDPIAGPLEVKLQSITAELAGLYGKRGFDGLTDEEEQRVVELESENAEIKETDDYKYLQDLYSKVLKRK